MTFVAHTFNKGHFRLVHPLHCYKIIPTIMYMTVFLIVLILQHTRTIEKNIQNHPVSSVSNHSACIHGKSRWILHGLEIWNCSNNQLGKMSLREEISELSVTTHYSCFAKRKLELIFALGLAHLFLCSREDFFAHFSF